MRVLGARSRLGLLHPLELLRHGLAQPHALPALGHLLVQALRHGLGQLDRAPHAVFADGLAEAHAGPPRLVVVAPAPVRLLREVRAPGLRTLAALLPLALGDGLALRCAPVSAGLALPALL